MKWGRDGFPLPSPHKRDMATKAQKKEEAISRIIKGLKCSREEAEEVYEYDLKVERDEKTEYDLDPARLKIAMKMTHAGVRTMPYTFTPRERKANITKQELIENIFHFLENENVTDIQILNKERLISFKIGDETFELTLVQKRRKK